MQGMDMNFDFILALLLFYFEIKSDIVFLGGRDVKMNRDEILTDPKRLVRFGGDYVMQAFLQGLLNTVIGGVESDR